MVILIWEWILRRTRMLIQRLIGIWKWERLILYTRSLRGIIGSTELARVHVVKRSY